MEANTGETNGKYGEHLFSSLLETYIQPAGRWQYLLLLLLLLPMGTPTSMFSVFSQLTPPHRCQIPLNNGNIKASNLSYDQITALFIPMKSDPELLPMIGQLYHPCLRYNISWLTDALMLSNGSFESLIEFRITAQNLNDANFTEPCFDGYAYDTNKKEFQGTIIENFNLVCESSYLDPLSITIFMIAQMGATAISGFIADRIGRRITIIITISMACITCVAISFSPNVICYIILRVFSSIFDISTYTLSYTYLMEITNSSHRTVFATVINFSGIIALSLYTLIAYLTPTWRWLSFGVACFNLPVIFMFWVLPESPRWLIVMGRKEEAFNVIKNAAKINRKHAEQPTLTDDALMELISKECNVLKKREKKRKKTIKSTIYDGLMGTFVLFRKPKLRLRTIALSIIWIHCSMNYYVLSFGSAKLVGNVYLNFWVICVSISLPAAGLQYLISCKIGRQRSLLGLTCMLVPLFAGIAVYQALQSNSTLNIGILISLSLGKLLIEVMVGIIYLYTLELYSTDICSYGSGFVSSAGKVGSALAPVIVYFGTSKWRPIPMIVGATYSVIVAITLCFLPETNGKSLHSTIAELEAEQNSLNMCRLCRGEKEKKEKESGSSKELKVLM